MTDNSAFKKLVRARMAKTGEKYTEACRVILANRDSRQPAIPISVPIDFPPESFTAILGGGGMTNLALVMPHLIDLAKTGHPVVIAAHEGRARTWTLGSPIDFLVAAGEIDPEELVDRYTSDSEEDKTHLRGLLEGLPFTFVRGAQPTAAWEAGLSAKGGKHAVLYVPDLNVDLPLSDWPQTETRSSLSSIDLMPAQLAGLRSIARGSRAAVIGGGVDSWEVIADIADTWIVVDDHLETTADGLCSVTLDFHSRWSDDPGPVRQEHTGIDARFSDWRLALPSKGEAV